MKSKLKAVLDDDRGVSPVIGVILMVAITVILAAVIGTFVLGLGDSLQTTPQNSVSISDAANDYSTNASDSDTPDDAFVISHSNGDSVQSSDIRVVLRNSDGGTEASFSSDSWTANDGGLELVDSAGESPSGQFSVGDTYYVRDTTSDSAELNTGEYTIQVIHVPSDSMIGESTVTLQ